MASVPIVYTSLTCGACEALRKAWGERGIEYEERCVDDSDDWMNEAKQYDNVVPIIVYEDGKVESGSFEGVYG